MMQSFIDVFEGCLIIVQSQIIKLFITKNNAWTNVAEKGKYVINFFAKLE